MWEISYQPSPTALKLNHANAHLKLLIISRSRMTALLHFPFKEKGRRWVKTDSVGYKQKASSLDESVKRMIRIDTRLDFIRAQLPRGSMLKMHQPNQSNTS